MRKYFVFQGNDHDCGFASLKIFLALTFKNKAYLSLSKPLDQKSHFSYSNLCQVALQQGVTLKAFEIEIKEQLLINKDFPLLVSLTSEKNEVHLVVLRKLSKKYAYLIDPNIGYIKIKIEDFFLKWNKTLLMIEGEVVKRDVAVDEPIICPKKKALLVLLQIFSSFFAIVALTFISQESFFIYPLGFFLLFILSEILFRRYQFKVLKTFDENYLFKTYDENKYQRKEKYLNFFQFKKLYFLHPQIIISSLLVVLFLLIILVLNNIFNLVFCLLLLAFSLIQLIYELNVNQKHIKILENLEAEVFSDDLENKNYLNLYQKIIEITYLLAKNETYKKYLGVFLCGVFALLLAAFSFEAKLNYFLFHFFAYLFLLEKTNELFQALSNQKKLNYLKARFIDKYVD